MGIDRHGGRASGNAVTLQVKQKDRQLHPPGGMGFMRSSLFFVNTGLHVEQLV